MKLTQHFTFFYSQKNCLNYVVGLLQVKRRCTMEEYFSGEWNEIWKYNKFGIAFAGYNKFFHINTAEHPNVFVELMNFSDERNIRMGIQLRGENIIFSKNYWQNMDETQCLSVQLDKKYKTVWDIVQYAYEHLPFDKVIFVTYDTKIQRNLLDSHVGVAISGMNWTRFLDCKMIFVAKQIRKISIATIHEHQSEEADYTNGICDVERVFADNFIMKNVCGFL